MVILAAHTPNADHKYIQIGLDDGEVLSKTHTHTHTQSNNGKKKYERKKRIVNS